MIHTMELSTCIPYSEYLLANFELNKHPPNIGDICVMLTGLILEPLFSMLRHTKDSESKDTMTSIIMLCLCHSITATIDASYSSFACFYLKHILTTEIQRLQPQFLLIQHKRNNRGIIDE